MSEKDCFVYKRVNEIITKLNKEDADFLKSIFDSLEKKAENTKPNDLPEEELCSRYYINNCVCCHTKETCPVETEIQALKRQIKEEKQDLQDIIDSYNKGDLKTVNRKLEGAYLRHKKENNK